MGAQARVDIASRNNPMEMIGVATLKLGKVAKKLNKYIELQHEQESKNLLQMLKSPKEYFKSKANPNYKAANSEDYLVYHLKQDIKPQDDGMFGIL